MEMMSALYIFFPKTKPGSFFVFFFSVVSAVRYHLSTIYLCHVSIRFELIVNPKVKF